MHRLLTKNFTRHRTHYPNSVIQINTSKYPQMCISSAFTNKTCIHFVFFTDFEVRNQIASLSTKILLRMSKKKTIVNGKKMNVFKHIFNGVYDLQTTVACNFQTQKKNLTRFWKRKRENEEKWTSVGGGGNSFRVGMGNVVSFQLSNWLSFF